MVSFTPTKKKGGGGGAENVLAMLKRGHNNFWGISFSHADGGGGGAKSFHPLKGGGGTNIFTLS